MRTISPTRLLLPAACLLFFLGGCGGDPFPSDHGGAWVYPGEDWAEAAPEDAGLDPARLEELERFFDPLLSSSFLVLRRGFVVWEKYWGSVTRETPLDGWSVSKSITSAAAGIAMEEGFFDLRQPAADFVEEWAWPDPRSAITLEHLFTMTSGLQWSWLEYVPIGLALFHLGEGDLLQAGTNLPLAYTPGTHWSYNNLACMVLSGVLSRATGVEFKEFARGRIAEPIGMRSFDWMTDPRDHTLTFMGISATARDLARFGYLFLRQGRWEDQQIVPSEWVTLSTRSSSPLNPAYGHLWWINGTSDSWTIEGMPPYRVPMNGRFFGESAPADTFAASGTFGQLIVVIPEYELVMVHTGASDFYDYRDAVNLLCDSVIVK
jgi:CubicO group peptidase (beta-lactamase class C family)